MKKKEELKINIQQIFTKIRNTINDREDELLLDIDNHYSKFLNENLIKISENLPNKIKLYLEKGKSVNNEWNDIKKLSSILNDCIIIEDNIKNINIINENIKKCNLKNEINFRFNVDDNIVDNLIQNIKDLGKELKNHKFDLNFKSLILKNENNINKLYNLISRHINIKDAKLLYSLTKDGPEFSIFVNKVNNKSNLIVLYLTGNKRIFGVFIKTKLENIKSSKYYKDENSFVFSLDNNNIYNILIPEYAIQAYSGQLLYIGNDGNCNGFFLSNNKIHDKGLLNSPKIYDFQKNGELTEGFEQLTELEIMEINS